MSDLRDLYQEVIIDHNKAPRNFYKLDDANYTAEGFNPLCGDHVNLFLQVDKENKIQKISFEGKGCAISIASASLMTEALLNKTVAEAEELFALFHDLMVLKDPKISDKLGKLKVLMGVREFPSRVKCATLAWHTLADALQVKGI